MWQSQTKNQLREYQQSRILSRGTCSSSTMKTLFFILYNRSRSMISMFFLSYQDKRKNNKAEGMKEKQGSFIDSKKDFSATSSA